MRYKDEQCPRCGNYVRGQFRVSGGRDFLTKGSKNLALFGADLALPGLGTVIDLTVGNKIDEFINDCADDLDPNDEYIFECPKCGQRWESSDRPPMPEEIIIQVRDAYVEALKKKRPYISMVIFSLLTLYCLVYFFIGLAEDNSLRVFGSFIFAILVLIPAILKWKKIVRINREIEECEYQSLLEFKCDHRDLFRQYSQYS